MIEAGATRIGASSGIRILEESLKESNQSESSDAPTPASGKVETPGSNY
jgi:hypothetical protein